MEHSMLFFPLSFLSCAANYSVLVTTWPTSWFTDRQPSLRDGTDWPLYLTTQREHGSKLPGVSGPRWLNKSITHTTVATYQHQSYINFNPIINKLMFTHNTQWPLAVLQFKKKEWLAANTCKYRVDVSLYSLLKNIFQWKEIQSPFLLLLMFDNFNYQCWLHSKTSLIIAKSDPSCDFGCCLTLENLHDIITCIQCCWDYSI